MLEVAGLNHGFGLRRVLVAVDFTVPEGVCAVLFGANGAGKTTLLKLIGSLLPLSRYPNRPSVKIDGFDLLDEPLEARARLGYMGHHPGHYRELTAV